MRPFAQFILIYKPRSDYNVDSSFGVYFFKISRYYWPQCFNGTPLEDHTLQMSVVCIQNDKYRIFLHRNEGYVLLSQDIATKKCVVSMSYTGELRK